MLTGFARGASNVHRRLTQSRRSFAAERTRPKSVMRVSLRSFPRNSNFKLSEREGFDSLIGDGRGQAADKDRGTLLIKPSTNPASFDPLRAWQAAGDAGGGQGPRDPAPAPLGRSAAAPPARCKPLRRRAGERGGRWVDESIVVGSRLSKWQCFSSDAGGR